MRKRIFSLILAVVMVLCESTICVSANQTVYESEPNNTPKTAQRIYHEDNVSATLDNMLGSDSMDYYTFTLAKSEKVRITAMSSNSNYGFRLDGPNGYVTGSESEGTYGGMYVQEIEMTLSAGTYYISVVGASYTDFGYALGLYAPSATPNAGGGSSSGAEDTLGSTIDNPYPAEAYDYFTHTMTESQLLMGGYYVSFTTPADGYLTLYYDMPNANPNYAQLIFTIYDPLGNALWSYENYDNIRSAHLEIPLVKGEYILCTQTTFSHKQETAYTAQYVFDYTYKDDCIVERMPNNRKESATLIAVGDTAFGLTNGNREYDYWALTVEKDCMVQISVESDIYQDGFYGNGYVVEEFILEDSYGNETVYSLYDSNNIVVSLTAGTNYILVSGSEIGKYQFTVPQNTECEEHDWDEWVVTQKATCEAEGSRTRLCKNCLHGETEIIPVTHNWIPWSTESNPTCEEPGLNHRWCYDCWYDDYEEVPALGHSFGDWSVQQQATCTAAGLESRSCTRCSHSESQPLEQLAHTFTNGICTSCGTQVEIPFDDVPVDAYFLNPVLWAVENHIAAGTGGGKFFPNQSCTRAQVVTFLWRAYGKQTPAQDPASFSDVAEDSVYHDAIMWAVDSGVTSGTGNGKFSPHTVSSRAHVVTFLWRAMGQPQPKTTDNPFRDVSESDYFYLPVLWAVENGITMGVSADSFSPNAPCTRGQVITFLYRALN